MYIVFSINLFKHRTDVNSLEHRIDMNSLKHRTDIEVRSNGNYCYRMKIKSVFN